MSVAGKCAGTTVLGGLGVALTNYGIAGLRVAEKIQGAGDNVVFFNTAIGLRLILLAAAAYLLGRSLIGGKSRRQ